MSGEQGLSTIPGILIDNLGMLPFVDLALMAEATDVDRVRQDLLEMSAAEEAAPRLSGRPIDAVRQTNILFVHRRL